MVENFELDKNINGIVLVDKPAGVSSNKVVNIVKHKIGANKCGHLGTLDLEGAGLLPVTVNKGTKMFEYFLSKTKTYETVFVFGFETDTLDTSGNITKECDCVIDTEDLQNAVKSMIGKQQQMPPQYSAKKVGGKVAYKEARKGNEVILQPKEIEIFDFKLLEQIDERTFRFEISCSSGTYIRSICRDLAYKMSTYGSMQSILRTRCGKFFLKDAFSIEQIENGDFEILSCADMFDFKEIILSDLQTEKLLNGQTIDFVGEEGQYKLFFDNYFLGVGEVGEGLKLSLRLI